MIKTEKSISRGASNQQVTCKYFLNMNKYFKNIKKFLNEDIQLILLQNIRNI